MPDFEVCLHFDCVAVLDLLSVYLAGVVKYAIMTENFPTGRRILNQEWNVRVASHLFKFNRAVAVNLPFDHTILEIDKYILFLQTKNGNAGDDLCSEPNLLLPEDCIDANIDRRIRRGHAIFNDAFERFLTARRKPNKKTNYDGK